MSLYVLREGFKVVTAPNGQGSIVHLRTGDELELSKEDVKLLERSLATGLDAMDPWITDTVERYRALGLLVPASFAPATTADPVAPHIPAAAAPTPAATSTAAPEHPVPCLRATLKMDAKPNSSVVNVSDPATGKSFQLYDFEVSMARMLDGRRSHADVVENARHIGLPVTFERLVRFIRELERYGFLSPPGTIAKGAADGKGSIWPARESWDEATRALYQSGLRMHRQGRYHESAAYFEAMLVQNPDNAEAKQMLEQARQRLSEPPAPSLTQLPSDAADPPIEQFDELSLGDAPTPQPAPRRSRKVLIAAAGVAVLALGLVVLMPVIQLKLQPGPAVVEPVAVVAADAGVEELVAVSPDPIKFAAVFDAGPAAAPTVAAPVDAGAAPEPAPVDNREWQEFAITRRGRVKMGEVVASATGPIEWKVTPEQRVKKGELVALIGENKLVAPVQGLVIQTVAEGEQARAGRPVAQILYHEAYAMALVTGPKPNPKWGCEVIDAASSQRTECTLSVISPRGPGFNVTAILLPRWFDAAADPKLRLAPP